MDLPLSGPDSSVKRPGFATGRGVSRLQLGRHEALPRQNGRAERLNRSLATEWASRQVFTSNDERATALAPWLEHYSTPRRDNARG